MEGGVNVKERVGTVEENETFSILHRSSNDPVAYNRAALSRRNRVQASTSLQFRNPELRFQ